MPATTTILPGTATPEYNLMRQKLGAKGTATRQRILDTVVRLVDVQTGEVPSISLICRASLISKATFYQYFEDFNALVLELLRPSMEDVERLAATLAQDWPRAELYERSHRFVAACFEHWDVYRVPLRLRNILADSGDKTMINQWLHATEPLVRGLAAKLLTARGGSRGEGDDHGIAIALMNAISASAMIVHHPVYCQTIDEATARIHSYQIDCQQRALAHLLTMALLNPQVPLVPNRA